MTEDQRMSISPLLQQFCADLRHEHVLPSTGLPETVAARFSQFFEIPCPMVKRDAGNLIDLFGNLDVYAQPGIERKFHVKGMWAIARGHVLQIILESTRPAPSQIKTVLHELAELILMVAYDQNRGCRPIGIRATERWANRFAAMIKMPPELFLPQFDLYGLDHQRLKQEFHDTLAGVSRQFRDLAMSNRPYYFCRFDIETNPDQKCPRLIPLLHRTQGICIHIRDAVKSNLVCTHRRKGELPLHNVGLQDEYRMLNPAFRCALSTQQPIFLPNIPGAAGYEETWHDLFGEQNLAFLMYHYGKKKTKGFYLVAVHPRDLCLLDRQRNSLNAMRRDDIDWLFSWERDRYQRVPDEMDDASPQEILPLGYDEEPDLEKFRWPSPNSDNETFSWGDL